MSAQLEAATSGAVYTRPLPFVRQASGFEKLFLRIGSDDVTPGSDRWLSQFRVQQQADHGHQILGALAAEEARVHEFALQLVRRMLPMRAASSRWVVVLQELLKGVETL